MTSGTATRDYKFARKHCLTSTGVPTFRVGKAFLTSALFLELPPKIRLYFILLQLLQQKNRTVFNASNKYLAKRAHIAPTNLDKVRKQLVGDKMITYDKATVEYAVLMFDGNGPLIPVHDTNHVPVNLTSEQIADVFTHYLGPPSVIHSDDDELRFICPFHESRHGAGKRQRLAVNLKSSAGMWSCGWVKCQHAGPHRFTDGRIAGGGNVLDLIIAMHQQSTGETITRVQADVILRDMIAASEQVFTP